MHLIATSILALLAIFSNDGKTAGSSLRECPSIGVSLETGNVVIGLHAIDDIGRMKCGWYRYIDLPRPDTNNYYRCTNYVFRTEGQDAGTVVPEWSRYTPKARKLTYSKLSIIEKLEKMNASTDQYANRWLEIKSKIEELGLKDKWDACTYIAADDYNFIASKPRISAFLGMTEKQLDEWLESCKY